ncbi:MAG: DUF488 domain-containing protein [Acidobacteriota bacterium]
MLEDIEKLNTIWTIGHSTRAIKEFVELIVSNGVRQILDVRTVPRSRHNPQFNLDELPLSLAKYGIDYKHLAGLGGLRHSQKDSINLGWRNASFRGYADYMQTDNFGDSLAEMMEIATRIPSALMCAEIVPWRCHRSMIGDALLVRRVEVLDIISQAEPMPHRLTPFAKVDGTVITYPPEASES